MKATCSFETSSDFQRTTRRGIPEDKTLFFILVRPSFSPSIIIMIKLRRMRWAGHVARMRAKRNACRILMGKPEGKRPLGSPRRRWVDSIKMDVREAGWGGMNCIDLAQDRDQWRTHVNTVMNLRIP
jgi:hypothetical protein